MSLKTAFPGVGVTPRSEISQSVLVKEILNVMIAVLSVNFMLVLVSIYIRALDHPILGPKFGPIPNVKKLFFSQFQTKKF